MRMLFGFPGWGWKMYGLASFRREHMWFIGFSKQIPSKAEKREESMNIEKQNKMWSEFNIWHKQQYGWELADHMMKEISDYYTSLIAWYAWCEATERAEKEIERLTIELRDTLAPDEDSPTLNAGRKDSEMKEIVDIFTDGAART